MSITVDWPSLRRALRETGSEEIPFLVTTEGAGTDVEAVVRSAAFALNDETQQTHSAFCHDPVEVPKGIAAVLDTPGSLQEAKDWFDELARRLANAGLSGQIRGARQDWGPRWAGILPVLGYGLIAQCTPLRGATPEQYEPGSLDIDLAATQTIAEVACRALAEPTANAYLVRGTFSLRTGHADIDKQLAQAAIRSGMAQATWIDAKVREVRNVALVGPARLLAGIGGENVKVPAAVGLLRHLAVEIAPHVEHASLRRVNPRSPNWDAQVAQRPPYPPGEASRFTSNLELQRRHVPDAYGVQILTDQHLERANDLSSWNIQSLGNERNLVTHPTPRAWYAGSEPEPAVLAEARRDFGDLIYRG